MNKTVLYHKNRPRLDDWITLIFDEFFELHGDRLFSDDQAMLCGIAILRGLPVTVIGHRKGGNTKENIKRGFGMPHPEGYRKALRLMRQAEKFSRPVITFVDTPGAFCGIGAEERGQGEAIARNLMEMMSINTPILTVFTGEGGSGGALGIAVSDRAYMLEHAMYSVISPRGCATILWKDPSREDEAVEKLKITAQDLRDFGVVDVIIPEDAGAHTDPARIARRLCSELSSGIEWAKGHPDLLDARYRRFRKFGTYFEE